MKIDDTAVVGHAVRNAELIARLRSRGVSLHDPRSIEHHFWSKSQRDAALLGNELYKRGFLILVIAPAAPKAEPDLRWNVEAGITDSVEHATSEGVVRELVELATSFNSRYDGWGTSI